MGLSQLQTSEALPASILQYQHRFRFVVHLPCPVCLAHDICHASFPRACGAGLQAELLFTLCPDWTR